MKDTYGILLLRVLLEVGYITYRTRTAKMHTCFVSYKVLKSTIIDLLILIYLFISVRPL